MLDLLHCMFMLLLRAVIFAFGYIFGCFHVLSLLGKLATTMANMPEPFRQVKKGNKNYQDDLSQWL